MRPQDVIKDAEDKIRDIIITRIVNRALSTHNVRIAASDEAKAQVGQQLDRVRAVLQPGVTVCDHIIAADRFVVNSTKQWPNWEKVTRPDEQDLVNHPWYHLYFKQCGHSGAFMIKMKAGSGDRASGGGRKETVVKVEGKGKASKDLASRPARRSSLATTAQTTVAVPTTTWPDSSCFACIDHGIACDPQPGRRCLQCKTRRRKCSHLVRVKRCRSVSRSPHATKRARTHVYEPTEHDLAVNPTESYVRADPPTPSRPPKLVPPALSLHVATDAISTAREDFNSLVRKHNAMTERVTAIEDAVISWARAVESSRRKATQPSGNPGPP